MHQLQILKKHLPWIQFTAEIFYYHIQFLLPGQGVYYNPPMNDNGKQVKHTGYVTDIITDLSLDWLKLELEAERFEAFRELSENAKLELLGYCVAQTLKPKLAPGISDEATAYDVSLSLTNSSVADYWRPSRDNVFGRLKRDQLLAIGREILGDAWANSHFGDKKSVLVDQLHRNFSDPDKSGRTPGQIEKLKSWLPEGMSFDLAASPKPTKAKKARKAA